MTRGRSLSHVDWEEEEEEGEEEDLVVLHC